jgi:hypothetical protein
MKSPRRCGDHAISEDASHIRKAGDRVTLDHEERAVRQRRDDGGLVQLCAHRRALVAAGTRRSVTGDGADSAARYNLSNPVVTSVSNEERSMGIKGNALGPVQLRGATGKSMRKPEGTANAG